MGIGRWGAADWKTYSFHTTAGKTTSEIYTSSKLKKEFNPKEIKVRESRDSNLNSNSNAIILALDVTGSMDPVLDYTVREGLNKVFTDIYDIKPIVDPHIMVMGIGDVEMGDTAPLQVTQFEADIKIAEQLKDIFIEHGGGGNMYESYALAWYFAAMRTSIDCFEKRGKKGYLFTIGDEKPTPYLTKSDIKKVTGDTPEKDLTGNELYDMVSKYYEVYHVLIQEGSNYKRLRNEADRAWAEVLGQNVLKLSDHKRLAETIVAAIGINEGLHKGKILGKWDETTAVIVGNATRDLSARDNSTGIVTL